MKKVLLVTLGCPKNLVDSEVMAGLLTKEGFSLTTNREDAETIVVNTCAFIQPAVSEAIETILDIAKLKHTARLKYLVVAGCLVQRYREDILREIPEVDACIGIDAIRHLPQFLMNQKKGTFACDPVDVEYLDLGRIPWSEGKTAYLKISEGCSNACTYCTIPFIRGKYRSRKEESILEEAESLAGRGIRELVVIGQDTTCYGRDLSPKKNLEGLLRSLSTIDGIRWIRIMYCYPENITPALIQEIVQNGKVLKYLDIPFQHASETVLKRMGRKSGGAFYENLVETLREQIPGLVLRTSFITGFPGETPEEFQELADFVRKMRFDHVGVFSYHPEEGTLAARLPGRIPVKEREKRRDILLGIQSEIVLEQNRRRLGGLYDILIEGVSEDGIFYEGRWGGQAPEVDGITCVASSQPLEVGDMVSVRMLDLNGHVLIGEVQS